MILLAQYSTTLAIRLRPRKRSRANQFPNIFYRFGMQALAFKRDAGFGLKRLG
jgi:hypothetical protein